MNTQNSSEIVNIINISATIPIMTLTTQNVNDYINSTSSYNLGILNPTSDGIVNIRSYTIFNTFRDLNEIKFDKYR